MKKHLRILFGADNRFKYVNDTIQVSHNFFDTVRIVNTGPDVLTEQFINLPPNVSIETLNFFYGDLEVARNNFLYDVDIGDYMMWLDSDERPSQSLLNNIDFLIDELEKTDALNAIFSVIPHIWEDEDDKLSIGCLHVPSLNRMVKKVHKYTSAISNFGGHGEIYNYDNFDKWYACSGDIGFINHYKSRLSIAQSAFTSVFANPCINSSVIDATSEYEKSDEFKLVTEFKLFHKVISNTDLIKKLYFERDEEFIADLKLLAENPILINSKLTSNYYKEWHMFSKKYNFSWETPDGFCGKDCCKYTNLQF